jgi:hypothetical protein
MKRLKKQTFTFKGNEVEGSSGADRIRLRGANIVFDTPPIATTNRTDENIRMAILSNGNVGIGTTTPNALLDVNSDVVVAGDLTAENLIIGSTNVITGDVVVAGDLTAENLIIGSTNVITELTSLDTRLDIEKPKKTALQILTATHNTDIALNTANILTKQTFITSSTDLETNSLTTTQLGVNGGVNIDTNRYFDTIVIRRPTGFSGDADFLNGI